MNTLKIAYFDKLGVKELKQAKINFENKHLNWQVILQSSSHEDAFAKLRQGQVDLAINDWRHEEDNFLKDHLADRSLMAVMQKGTYQTGVQMIEKDELADLTCFLICSPKEEIEELHLHKDLWQIKSPFIAVGNFDEAGVLISSGSGYFIMNEETASLLSNDTLQKLFLLDHGQQMKQSYYAFYRKDDKIVSNFIAEIEKEYRN